MILGEKSRGPSQLQRFVPLDFLSFDKDASFSWTEQPSEKLDERRLPTSILSDDDDKRRGGQCEGNILQNDFGLSILGAWILETDIAKDSNKLMMR